MALTRRSVIALFMATAVGSMPRLGSARVPAAAPIEFVHWEVIRHPRFFDYLVRCLLMVDGCHRLHCMCAIDPSQHRVALGANVPLPQFVIDDMKRSVRAFVANGCRMPETIEED